MRTRYETPNDIRNEKVALDILLDYLGTGYSWDKGGKRKGLDATLYKDSKPYCLIEVKTRNPKFFRLAQTDGYLIAKQKWNKLLALDARLVVYWLALVQYLEVLRREQKKTSDIVTGVGVILIIVFSLSVFGWHPWG